MCRPWTNREVFDPPAQGLYNPQRRARCVRRRIRCAHQGTESHAIVRRRCRSSSIWSIAARAAVKRTPVTAPASWSRCRTPFCGRSSRSRCRRPARTARASSSCRTTNATATHQGSSPHRQEEGQRLLGWRDVPTDNRLVGDSAGHAAGVPAAVHRRAADELRRSRAAPIRAQAVRDPQASRARRRQLKSTRCRAGSSTSSASRRTR